MLIEYIGVTHGIAHQILLFFVVMIFNTISFFFCYYIYNDLSVTHISWGLLFMIPNFAIIAE